MSTLASFYFVFCFLATVGSLAVIFFKNPMHSVFALVLSFISSAGLLILQGCDFLAMLLVIVYVGAVAVLFLFVVMMLGISGGLGSQCGIGFRRIVYQFFLFLLSSAAGFLLFSSSTLLVFEGSHEHSHGSSVDDSAVKVGNTMRLGKVLYTRYLFVFQLTAMLLLAAMVCALAVGFRPKIVEKRTDDVAESAKDDRLSRAKMMKVPFGSGLDY